MEINGHRPDEIDPRTGRPRLLSGFTELEDDGSTACGCWIYSGVFPEPGRNLRRERRRTGNPLEPDWGYAWPSNRRILYNRASADPEGRPWSERKKLIWWDARAGPLGGVGSAGLRAGQTARLPAAARRQGNGGDRGHAALHNEARRRGLAVRPGGVRGRAAARPLRARRVACGNLLYPRQTVQPDRADIRGSAQPRGARTERGIPGGGHHVPAYRTLPQWADEPVQQLAQRIDAGDVRGVESGAGGRAAASPTAGG